MAVVYPILLLWLEYCILYAGRCFAISEYIQAFLMHLFLISSFASFVRLFCFELKKNWIR